VQYSKILEVSIRSATSYPASTHVPQIPFTNIYMMERDSPNSMDFCGEVDYLQKTRVVAKGYRRSPYVQRASVWHSIRALNPVWWNICAYIWDNHAHRVYGYLPQWHLIIIIARVLGSIPILAFMLVYTIGVLERQLIDFILGRSSKFVWQHTIGSLTRNMARHQNKSVYIPLRLDSSK
ncbi:hypothetical protein GQ44DRAFT_796450, partial [Phaeosphaeriaceae sp. PMI808]